MPNGDYSMGFLSKILITGLATIVFGWISFISVYSFNLGEVLHEHMSTSNAKLSQIANDVQWMKNETQKGGRFTARDGAVHDSRIEKNEQCCDENRERIIKMEPR